MILHTQTLKDIDPLSVQVFPLTNQRRVQRVLTQVLSQLRRTMLVHGRDKGRKRIIQITLQQLTDGHNICIHLSGDTSYAEHEVIELNHFMDNELKTSHYSSENLETIESSSVSIGIDHFIYIAITPFTS